MAANNPLFRCRPCLNNSNGPVVTDCGYKHLMVSHLASNHRRHPNHSMGYWRCTACPFIASRVEGVRSHITRCNRVGHQINHRGATAFRDPLLVATVNAEADQCAFPHLNAYVAPAPPNAINVAAAHVEAVARYAATSPAAAMAINNQAALVVPAALLAAIIAAPDRDAAVALVDQHFGVQPPGAQAVGVQAPPAVVPAPPAAPPAPPVVALAPPAAAPAPPAVPVPVVLPPAFVAASNGPMDNLPDALHTAVNGMFGGAPPPQVPAVQLPAPPPPVDPVALAQLPDAVAVAHGADQVPPAGINSVDGTADDLDDADETGGQLDRVDEPSTAHETGPAALDGNEDLQDTSQPDVESNREEEDGNNDNEDDAQATVSRVSAINDWDEEMTLVSTQVNDQTAPEEEAQESDRQSGIASSPLGTPLNPSPPPIVDDLRTFISLTLSVAEPYVALIQSLPLVQDPMTLRWNRFAHDTMQGVLQGHINRIRGAGTFAQVRESIRHVNMMIRYYDENVEPGHARRVAAEDLAELRRHNNI